MSREFWIQDRNDWHIGRWLKLFVSKDPLPHDLETKEFGDVIRVRELLPDEPDYKAKCERLKAALREIAKSQDYVESQSTGMRQYFPTKDAEIAKAALEEK